MNHYDYSKKTGKDRPHRRDCSSHDLILHNSGLACVNCGWTKDMEKKEIKR